MRANDGRPSSAHPIALRGCWQGARQGCEWLVEHRNRQGRRILGIYNGRYNHVQSTKQFRRAMK